MPKPLWNALQAKQPTALGGYKAPAVPLTLTPKQPQPSIIPVKNTQPLQGRYEMTDTGSSGWGSRREYGDDRSWMDENRIDKVATNNIGVQNKYDDTYGGAKVFDKLWGQYTGKGDYYDWAATDAARDALNGEGDPPKGGNSGNGGGGGDGYGSGYYDPYAVPSNPDSPDSEPYKMEQTGYKNPWEDYKNPYETWDNPYMALYNSQKDPRYDNYYQGLMAEFAANRATQRDSQLKAIEENLKAAQERYKNQAELAKQQSMQEINDNELASYKDLAKLREAQANRGQLDSGLSRQEALSHGAAYSNRRSNLLMNMNNSQQEIQNLIAQAMANADTEKLNANTQYTSDITNQQNALNQEKRAAQKDWNDQRLALLDQATGYNATMQGKRDDYDTKMRTLQEQWYAADAERKMDLEALMQKLNLQHQYDLEKLQQEAAAAAQQRAYDFELQQQLNNLKYTR